MIGRQVATSSWADCEPTIGTCCIDSADWTAALSLHSTLREPALPTRPLSTRSVYCLLTSIVSAPKPATGRDRPPQRETPRSLVFGPDAAKTQREVPRGWPGPESTYHTREPISVEPGSTAYSLLAFTEALSRPFPDVSRHIDTSIWAISPRRVPSYRRCALHVTSGSVALPGVEDIAPGIGTSIGSTGGLLPLLSSR